MYMYVCMHTYTHTHIYIIYIFIYIYSYIYVYIYIYIHLYLPLRTSLSVAAAGRCPTAPQRLNTGCSLPPSLASRRALASSGDDSSSCVSPVSRWTVFAYCSLVSAGSRRVDSCYKRGELGVGLGFGLTLNLYPWAAEPFLRTAASCQRGVAA